MVGGCGKAEFSSSLRCRTHTVTVILTRQKVGQFACASVSFSPVYAILNKVAMPTLERSMFSCNKFCLESKVEPRDPKQHNQGRDWWDVGNSETQRVTPPVTEGLSVCHYVTAPAADWYLRCRVELEWGTGLIRPSPPPAPRECWEEGSGHLPLGKTKWSPTGESSMRWGKVAHSRCKERQNRCTEEGCRCSWALAPCLALELHALSSWQPHNHHREAFCPLAALLSEGLGGLREAKETHTRHCF